MTSFIISEPVERLEVSAMLYDLAWDEQKKILWGTYDVKPFNVQTNKLERIFIDKLFAAETYVRNSSVEHRAFAAAKHIYDLAVMAEHPKVVQLLSGTAQMESLLKIRMEEELGRLDGIPGVSPNDFIFSHKPAIMPMSARLMILCRTNMYSVPVTELNSIRPHPY